MSRTSIEKLYGAALIQEIIEAYIFEELSMVDIEKRYSLKTGAVRNILVRNNIELRRYHKNFSEIEKEEIKEFYISPKSLKQTAQKFQCSVKAICLTLDSINVSRRESCKQLNNPYNTNPEFREQRRAALRGEKNPKWKGGKISLEYKIRALPEYNIWRNSVYVRDNYTCIQCHSKSTPDKKVMLHAHHIKELKNIIQEWGIKNIEEAIVCAILWDVNNGACLCSSCHTKLHL